MKRKEPPPWDGVTWYGAGGKVVRVLPDWLEAQKRDRDAKRLTEAEQQANADEQQGHRR